MAHSKKKRRIKQGKQDKPYHFECPVCGESSERPDTHVHYDNNGYPHNIPFKAIVDKVSAGSGYAR